MTEQNLESLSLVELKNMAKERRIKQYYIKKRSELIEILRQDTLPLSYTLEKMTIAELREKAKEKGLRGFWSLHRDDLIKILFPNTQVKETPTNKQEKDNRHAEEHQDPQSHDAQNVGV